MEKYNIEKQALFNPIGEKVLKIRNQYVMLDRDLAGLYGVETKQLNRQVKRNLERFDGDDYMFQLSEKEFANWRCQFGTSNSVNMGVRYAPYAFTELGVSMLSSVLNSPLAIRVNRQIMRYFVHMRKLELSDNHFKKYVETRLELLDEKLKKHEGKMNNQSEVIKDILEQIRRMIATPPAKVKKQIGFRKE